MSAKEDSAPFITPVEAARMIGIAGVVKDPHRCIRRMARNGELVARTICGRIMIQRASVDRYIGRTL